MADPEFMQSLGYNFTFDAVKYPGTPEKQYSFFQNFKGKGLNNLFVEAARLSELGILNFLVKNNPNYRSEYNADYALTRAIIKGNSEIVKYLLENGVDIHTYDDYALKFAARKGNIQLVKYLVEKGADIHADYDITLSWTSEKGHLDVVKYLVEKGANIHARNDNAIKLALKNGHLNVAEYLQNLK